MVAKYFGVVTCAGDRVLLARLLYIIATYRRSLLLEPRLLYQFPAALHGRHGCGLRANYPPRQIGTHLY